MNLCDVNKIYYGSDEIAKVYKGSDLVWPCGFEFITVGPGAGVYDYEHIKDAFVAANNGDYVLCYGTTQYSASGDTVVEIVKNKTIFIRGMGESPEDTVITSNQYMWTLEFGEGCVFTVENITSRRTTDLFLHGITFDKNATGVVNKCLFDSHRDGHYPVAGTSKTSNNPNNTGAIEIRNCKISRGQSHFHALNLSKITMTKSELNNALTTSYTPDTTLAGDDYVTTPTAGYGYEYGTLIITDEFLELHGY